MKNYLQLLLLLLFGQQSDANEGLLLDTRQATTDLGWEIGPNSGWDEISGHDDAGNEYRMFQICEITRTDQQNWLRTNYINTFSANRVFVEIEFTIRSCEDLANVKVCRETFNLLYYEADNEQDTPQWNTLHYKKVDTVAADRRFSPEADSRHRTNFETREIGNLTKNGLFIAIQDTGACMALMHLKVYYKFCPETVENLAVFPRTVSGPDLTSLEEATGTCVDNAQMDPSQSPRLYCNAKGDWTLPTGKCQCVAGFSPSKDFSSCEPCRKGTYKSETGNGPCSSCPRNSVSNYGGADVCTCRAGYYRAADDSVDAACSTTPSAPRDFAAFDISDNDLRLSWMGPSDFGDRREIEYKIECTQNNLPCPRSVDASPSWIVQSRSVQINGLDASSNYEFRVYALNDISSIAGGEAAYAQVIVSTADRSPAGIAMVEIVQYTSSTARIAWQEPRITDGVVNGYETVLENKNNGGIIRNMTTDQEIFFSGLVASNVYVFKVRARTSNGLSPYSNPEEFKTYSANTRIPSRNPEFEESTVVNEESNTGAIAGAAAGGAVILIMLVVFLVICTRKNTYHKGDKYVHELGVTDVTFHPVHPVGKNAAIYGMEHTPWLSNTSDNQHQPNQELEVSQVEVGSTLRRATGNQMVELLHGSFRPFNGQAPEPALIKRLRVGFTGQQKAEFLNDADIIAQFRHENVLEIKGVISHTMPLLSVYEYMEHPFADEFLRMHRGQLSQVQLQGMIRNVAAGMKYLIEQGYLHRDLQCAHLAVSANLTVKIAEFSQARRLAETFVPTVGKCSYKWSAPEVISQRIYSEASDVWSFGVTAWEIINFGDAPYWEMNDEEVIRKIETGYRLPLGSNCPPALQQILLECWKSSSNERPPFNRILKQLDHSLRSPSNRTSQYSGSCMTLDSNASSASSLGQWLEGIGLAQYRERLQQNGFGTLDEIIQMSRTEMRDLGINSLNEQNHLQDAARAFAHSRARQTIPYGNRCDMSLERGTTVAV